LHADPAGASLESHNHKRRAHLMRAITAFTALTHEWPHGQFVDQLSHTERAPALMQMHMRCTHGSLEAVSCGRARGKSQRTPRHTCAAASQPTQRRMDQFAHRWHHKEENLCRGHTPARVADSCGAVKRARRRISRARGTRRAEQGCRPRPYHVLSRAPACKRGAGREGREERRHVFRLSIFV